MFQSERGVSRPAFFGRSIAVLLAAVGMMLAAAPARAVDFEFISPLSPCEYECKAHLFAGVFVRTGFTTIIEEVRTPFNVDYDDDYIAAVALSRPILRIGDFAQIEPEIGIGQRFGEQDETEAWAALYLRQIWFPWNDYVTTTVAVSTGLNYASAISDKERSRAGNSKGAKLLHYFSPEITFARPSDPDTQLVFRFHHRSGGYGLVDETKGGAQYGTVGVKFTF